MATDDERSAAEASMDHRRKTKPIMEKRRRARINASLSELKSLLLEVMKKDGSRHNKMEKADILEMTVKHLRQLQRAQFQISVAASQDSNVLNKYHAGFNECANEVSRYLSGQEGLDVETRARLLNHLANCIQGLPPSNVVPSSTSRVISRVVTPKRNISPLSSSSTSPPSPISITSSSLSGVATAHVRPIQSLRALDSAGEDEKRSDSSEDDVPSPISSPETVKPMITQHPYVVSSSSSGSGIALVIPGNMISGVSSQASVQQSYIIPVYAGGQIAPVMLSSAGGAHQIVSSPQQLVSSPSQLTTTQIASSQLTISQLAQFQSQHALSLPAKTCEGVPMSISRHSTSTSLPSSEASMSPPPVKMECDVDTPCDLTIKQPSVYVKEELIEQPHLARDNNNNSNNNNNNNNDNNNNNNNSNNENYVDDDDDVEDDDEDSYDGDNRANGRAAETCAPVWRPF